MAGRMELPMGAHEVTIEKEGFETEEQAITLKEDDTHELVFQLKKSDG